MHEKIRHIIAAAVLISRAHALPKNLEPESRGSKNQSIGWLAFGDLRGNIEPCGCDPKSDLGGLLRLGTLIKRERDQNPGIGVFDLGNNIDLIHPSLKTEFINRGLDFIQPTASLANTLELRVTAPRTSRPTVLTNLRENTKDLHIKSHVLEGRWLIFGYTRNDEVSQKTHAWGVKLEKKISTIRGKHADKTSVLLISSSSPNDIKKVSHSNLFDIIVSSNPRNLLNKATDLIEKENPNLLFVQRHPIEIKMVPLGGLGVLRGGTLKNSQANSLEELIKKAEGGPSLEKKSSLYSSINQQPRYDESWLSHSFDRHSPLTQHLDAYREAQKGAFARLIKEREKNLAKTEYVGSQACLGCHQDSYSTWKKSSHAHAYGTLQEKGQHQNPECVGCHVVGFHEVGGFVSETITPQFKGVQCENCHGPRKGHIANPAMKVTAQKANLQACTECHQGAHSPNFHAKKYWLKIAHPESKARKPL